MGVPGRKSAVEELQIMQRYSVLAPKFFAVLNKFLASKKPEDQKWAAEQLTKAYVKMIPQQIAGDPNNPLTLQITGMKIVKDGDNISNKKR